VFTVRYELGSYISENNIYHSHRREDFKYYVALTGGALHQRRNVYSVRYELCFYIPEDAFFIVIVVKTNKPNIILTGWVL
jgi:hypothetical protein